MKLSHKQSIHPIFFLFLSAFSNLDLPLGSRILIPIPSAGYTEGFKGRAFILGTTEKARNPPAFRAALSVESADGGGEYLCSLVVLLGDLKVWTSDHFSRFLVVERCVLELTRDGNLQLLDKDGGIGWQTKTSWQAVKRLHLQISTGNLILFDAENGTKWQSFDSPANIMLWGQQLKAPIKLTNSPIRSSSVFFYSLEVQRSKLAAYLNWGHYKYSYLELNPSGGRKIEFARLGSKGLRLFDKHSKKIGQVNAVSPGPVRLLALGRTGNLEMFYYSASHLEFEAAYRAPGDYCDLPLRCGPCGICTSLNTCIAFPRTKCMQENYNRFSVMQSEVEMVELSGIETILRTVSPMPSTNISKDQCVSSCLVDCSCAAVQYYSRDGNGRESECSQYGEVVGTRDFSRGNEFSYWVKVPRERDEHSALMKKLMILGGVVDGLVLCFILGGLLYYLLWRLRKEQSGKL